MSQFAKSDFTLTPEKGINFNKEGDDFLYQTKEILNFMNDENKDGGGEEINFRNNETMFESFIDDEADNSYYQSQHQARVGIRKQTGSNGVNNTNTLIPKLEKRLSILDKDSLLTYLRNYSPMKFVLLLL